MSGKQLIELCRRPADPPLSALVGGERRGEVGVGCPVAHLTLPIADATGPLPLPPKTGGEGNAWPVRLSAGIALCILILSLALAGCGKRNAPEPPPDQPNTYPRSYPSE